MNHQKVFKKRLLWVALLTALSLLAAGILVSCGGGDKGGGKDGTPPETTGTEKLLYGFNEWYPDFHLIQIREKFGIVDINTNAAYVKEGKGSAKLRPAGRYTGSERPYLSLPLVWDELEIANGDLTFAETIEADIYNAESASLNVYVGLFFQEQTHGNLSNPQAGTVPVKYELTPGWNKVSYEIDKDALSLKWDIKACRSVYYAFDNIHSRDITDAPTLYLDNVTMVYSEDPVIVFTGEQYLEIGKEYNLGGFVKAYDKDGNVIACQIGLYRGAEKIELTDGKFTPLAPNGEEKLTLKAAAGGVNKEYALYARAGDAANDLISFRTDASVNYVQAAAAESYLKEFDADFSFDGNGSFKFTTNSEWPVVQKFTFLGHDADSIAALRDAGYDTVQLMAYFDMPGTEYINRVVFGTSIYGDVDPMYNPKPLLPANVWVALEMPISDLIANYAWFVAGGKGGLLNSEPFFIHSPSKAQIGIYFDCMRAVKKDVSGTLNLSADGGFYTGNPITASASATYAGAFGYSVRKNGQAFAMAADTFTPDGEGVYTVSAASYTADCSYALYAKAVVRPTAPGEYEYESFDCASALSGIGAYLNNNDPRAVMTFDPYVSYDGNGSLKYETELEWFEIKGVMPRIAAPAGATHVSMRIKFDCTAEGAIRFNFLVENAGLDWLGEQYVTANTGEWTLCAFELNGTNKAALAAYGFRISPTGKLFDDGTGNGMTIRIDDIRFACEQEVTVGVSESGGVYTINAAADGVSGGEFTYTVYKDGVLFDNGGEFTPDGEGTYKVTAEFDDGFNFGFGAYTFAVRNAPGEFEYESFDSQHALAGIYTYVRPDLTDIAFVPGVSYDGNGSLKVESTFSWWELSGIMPRAETPAGADRLVLMLKYETNVASDPTKLFQFNCFTTSSTGTRGVRIGDADFAANNSGGWVKCAFDITGIDLQYGINLFINGIAGFTDTADTITVWIDDIRFACEKAVTVNAVDSGGVYTVSASASGLSPSFTYKVYKNDVLFGMDSADTFTPDSTAVYKITAEFDDGFNFGFAQKILTLRSAPAADEYESFDCPESVAGIGVYPSWPDPDTVMTFDPLVSRDGNGSLKYDTKFDYLEVSGIMSRIDIPAGASKITFYIKFDCTVAGTLRFNFFSGATWLGDADLTANTSNWELCTIVLNSTKEAALAVNGIMISTGAGLYKDGTGNSMTIWIDDIRFE
ncbi:MAG: hypothetical protein FWE62_00720 [Firmicutes bacterium]|nr:hypothetical protein [Bacillota bacterium]